MFDWLFEGYWSLYFLLGAAAILFVIVWVRTRKRRWLAGTAVAVVLAGLYCLLDFAVETDREQIQRKTTTMAAAFKSPVNLDAVFENVSDEFHTTYADNKTALLEQARQHIQMYHITEVRISDVKVGDISRERSTAIAAFRAKIVGSFGALEAVTVTCTANFDHDQVHGWRMRDLEVRGEPPIQEFMLGP